MNISSVITKDYENKSNWTLGENKPNQTQPVVSLSNLFQTGHLLVNRMKPKFLNFHLKNSLAVRMVKAKEGSQKQKNLKNHKKQNSRERLVVDII